MDPVGAFELLKEELDNDEIYVRVNAIHRLKTVAVLIGTEGIKSNLLPFLDTIIKKEDDEVLFAIAEELGNLGSLLPQQQSILIPFLETLAGVEETVVRDMAVQSLNTICATLNDYEILNNYIPLILKLANNEINFTCRVSAVNLMYSIYPKSGTHKEKIRIKFGELCKEETPMVRRAVASKIGEFAKNLEKEFLITDIISIFKTLCSDEQDQVRVLCLDSLKQLAQIFSREEKKTYLIPLIIQATSDKSWRVRLSLSKNFAELANAFGKEITDASLIQIFVNLLKDVENDVKIAAIQSLSLFLKNISPEKLSILIIPIQNLAKDGNAQVRAGVIDVISRMIPLIGKEVSQQKILPLIIEFFADENTDVRIGVANAACKFIITAGLESFVNVSAHFKNAIQDNKWRVRSSVLENLIELAINFQNYDFMTKSIDPIFFFYLKDRVYFIRDMVVGKLKKLAQIYKSEWVAGSLIPKINENLTKENSYLSRITALYSLQAVCSSMTPEFNKEKILPIILRNSKDPVANVRFVITKILKSLANNSFGNNSQQITQCLNELAADTDKDVQYFANDALKIL